MNLLIGIGLTLVLLLVLGMMPTVFASYDKSDDDQNRMIFPWK